MDAPPPRLRSLRTARLGADCTAPVPALHVPFDQAVPEDVIGGSPVTLHGDASAGADGLHLDGDGDLVSIPSFGYAEDGQFAVSFWFRNQHYGSAPGVIWTGHKYEYLFSHGFVSVGAADAHIVIYLQNSRTPSGLSHFLKFEILDSDIVDVMTVRGACGSVLLHFSPP